MNMFCIYISVRRTIIELQPFIRLANRTPATRLQGHLRSKLMVPLERASTSFYLKVSKRMSRTHHLRDIGDFRLNHFSIQYSVFVYYKQTIAVIHSILKTRKASIINRKKNINKLLLNKSCTGSGLKKNFYKLVYVRQEV